MVALTGTLPFASFGQFHRFRSASGCELYNIFQPLFDASYSDESQAEAFQRDAITIQFFCAILLIKFAFVSSFAIFPPVLSVLGHYVIVCYISSNSFRHSVSAINLMGSVFLAGCASSLVRFLNRPQFSPDGDFH